MGKVCLSAFAVAWSGILALSVMGQETATPATATPTIDQSLEWQSAFNPKISPDGRRVVYEVQKTSWEENAFERNLSIADIASGETHALTTAKKSSTNPQWSPDGKWIAFLSDRPGQLAGTPEGKKQLYVISVDGGEAQQLTKVESDVNDFEWAPDSKRIAFSMSDPETKAMKDRKEKYGEYSVVHGDYQMSHLWTIELSTGSAAPVEPKRLTEGDKFSVGDFAWSPDGTRVAFSAQRDPDLISGDTADLYTVAVSDKAVKKIVSTPGPDRNPKWSPDGKKIAFQTAAGSPSYYYTNSKIGIVGADGGAVQILTESFDEDPGLIAWGPDGIYFAAAQKTAVHLFRLNPATGVVEKLSAPEGLVVGSGLSFSHDYKTAAYRAALPNEYAEIYTTSVVPWQGKKLTAMGDQLKGFKLAHREVISWKSGDGTTIEGILYTPRDFDAKRKYPLLVVIHGGPTGVDQPVVFADHYYPVERFVAKGALVLRPNYRGSAGYGEKFRSLNVRNLGIGDYADVISGVDSLIAKGYVDKDRVGAMGWSQGGYISAYIATLSDRFKAVSVGAGISDWSTYYVNTDITPFTRQYLHATPWDDPEIYWKTSPISNISKARTPTLIQHGENDRRVPIPNAYELRQAPDDRGVPVKMVVYKGFGHGINKPKQQRAVMEENEKWFAQYIWGEKPEAGKPAEPKKDEKKSAAAVNP